MSIFAPFICSILGFTLLIFLFLRKIPLTLIFALLTTLLFLAASRITSWDSLLELSLTAHSVLVGFCVATVLLLYTMLGLLSGILFARAASSILFGRQEQESLSRISLVFVLAYLLAALQYGLPQSMLAVLARNAVNYGGLFDAFGEGSLGSRLEIFSDSLNYIFQAFLFSAMPLFVLNTVLYFLSSVGRILADKLLGPEAAIYEFARVGVLLFSFSLSLSLWLHELVELNDQGLAQFESMKIKDLPLMNRAD